VLSDHLQRGAASGEALGCFAYDRTTKSRGFRKPGDLKDGRSPLGKVSCAGQKEEIQEASF
jgi:hypothetical protein